MASTDARPFPLKNTAYRVYFPLLDADGDLVTSAAGLDSEVSIDGAAFADCTNEATEIATSSGMYYLDLTSSEMNGDAICVIVKTSTVGAKTTPIVMYPEEAGDIRVNVTQNAGTNITSASGRQEVNVSHIAGSAVSTSTAQIGVNVVNFGGSAGTFASGRPEVNTSHIAGSAVSTSSAQIGVNVVNAGGTAWASGSLTAAVFAADAITAAKVAADVGTEIGTAVWATTTRELTALDEDVTTIDLNATAIGSVVGAVGSVTGNVGGNVVGSVGSVAGAVGSVTGNVGGNVAGSVGSVTGLTASDVGAIKAKTDSLTFTVASVLDANIQRVNDVAIVGDGSGTPFNV